MIIKIGTRIYETDFSVDDLYTFYKYGNGYTIEDKPYRDLVIENKKGGEKLWKKL